MISSRNNIYIIIGASRGLGASLVGKCLENGLEVIGIGRTSEDKIENMEVWQKTKRFRYVRTDIGEPLSVEKMKSIIGMCEGRPVCIIFNAAIIDSDVGSDGAIMFDIFKNVNHVGVNGFGHVLEAFSDYLVSHGGMFIGISSISAWMPPVGGNKIAYPASKAYLDMALRSLRLLWDKKVHVMTVHLGSIGGSGSFFIPGYNAVAQRLIKAFICGRPPESICISAPYCIAYGIMKNMPDRIISGAIAITRSLANRILKRNKSR